MAEEPTPEELAARLDELRDAVEDLQQELQPRGPFGLPRPPTPREAAQFTAEYGIPAAIATLEATVRSLELLQAALRAADPGRGDLPDAEATGEAVLEGLDRALADLQATLEDRPPNAAAGDLLAEVRRLNGEIRESLDDAREASRPAGPENGDDTGRQATDVEDELETIRREVGDGTDTEDDGADDDPE